MSTKQYNRVPANNRVPLRKSREQAINQRYEVARTAQVPIEADEKESFYQPLQIGRSARRYVNPKGQEVIEQGQRRFIIHEKSGQPGKPGTRVHWLALTVAGMLAAILLILLGSWLVNGIQNYQLAAQYGMPRTYQVDMVVGQDGDSSQHPTHFTFQNLNGHVVIIELPAGNVQKAIIYSGPQIFGNNVASIPITATFQDVNGDGKLDMIVQLGNNQSIIYLNNGSKFIPQQ